MDKSVISAYTGRCNVQLEFGRLPPLPRNDSCIDNAIQRVGNMVLRAKLISTYAYTNHYLTDTYILAH